MCWRGRFMFMIGILVGVGGMFGYRKVKRILRPSFESKFARKFLTTPGVPDDVKEAVKKVTEATDIGDKTLARIALMQLIHSYRSQVPDPEWLEAIQPKRKFLTPRHILWNIDLEDESVPESISTAALDARDAIEAFDAEILKPEHETFMKGIIKDLDAEERAYRKK